MSDLLSLGSPIIVIGILVLGFLIAMAPLAIWVHAANAARSLKRQEAMLGEIVDRLKMEPVRSMGSPRQPDLG